MSHDMQQLQNQADDAFTRRLLDALPAMRCGPSGISQAIQSDAGGAPVCPDAAQGGIEPGRDFGGCAGTQGVRGQV